MSELTKRILFALLAAPLFVYVLWLGGWFFYGLMVLISIMVHREISAMIASGSQKQHYGFSLLLMLSVISYPVNPFFFEALVLIFSVWILKETIDKDAGFFQNSSATLFTAVYTGITFLGIIRIRLGPDLWTQAGMESNLDVFAYTFLFVLMIWGNDVFAYFGGRALGKHPLAPSISPKKTWEGFFFGFLGGGVALAILFPFFTVISASFWVLLPLVFLTGIFGPIGDLAASKIKRAYHIKDSSNLLPGHGGFFDRFDAMMLASLSYLVYMQWVIW